MNNNKQNFSQYTPNSTPNNDDETRSAKKKGPIKKVHINPTTDQKIDFITKQLETNFPTKTTFLIGLMHISVGLAAFAIQIVLIVNDAINNQVGGGIWGGVIAILSGSIKLNLCNLYFNKFD